MELRTIKGIPLETYTDEVFKVSYTRILTQYKYETIKLPTNINAYRYEYLIQPTKLIEVELVKTKKNWILKSILNSTELANLALFEDYLKLTELVKICRKYFREEQELEVLGLVIKTFNHQPFKQIDIAKFEQDLLGAMGFGEI